MGEAKYTMRIEFDSEDEATRRLPEIEKLFEDLNDLYDDWQRIRNQFREDPQERMNVLIEKYSDLFDKIKLPRKAAMPFLNELSGNIAMGSEFTVNSEDNVLVVVAPEVWHCSSWDGHCRAMEKHYGARHATWKKEY